MVSNVVKQEQRDFEQTFSEYPYSTQELQKILVNKSTDYLQSTFQSVHHLTSALFSSKLTGLSEQQVIASRSTYGKNRVEPPPPTPFYKLMLDAIADLTMIILIVASIVSIILSTTLMDPAELEWIDGVAIMVAVVIVVMVTSCNDYSKEKQFRKLNAVKNDKLIKVLRDGVQTQVSIYDIVVGDVVLLETGDQIPADGVIMQSTDLKVDESGMTGESDEVKKSDAKPFLIGSCLVTHGSAKLLVTSVGAHSIFGEILLTLQENEEDTPLQEKLDDLAKIISYFGVGAAVLVFLALIIKFWVAGKQSDPTNYIEFVKYFMLAVIIIVVAVPEGLPLAVTISLAYSMKKMLTDQCLVRKLESCETMGSVSNICTDKTGTLTLNQMRVQQAVVGKSNFNNQNFTQINPSSQKMLNLISSVCSTAQLVEKSNTGLQNQNTSTTDVVGSKTEGALLILSKQLGCDYNEYRAALTVGDNSEGALAKKNEFTSDRKRMSVILDAQAYKLQIGFQKRYIALCKGASEIVLRRCTSYLDGDQVKQLSQEVKQMYEQQIVQFANQSLRTLILAYREVDQLPENPEDIEEELTLVGLVGIMDPLRPGVPEAISNCQGAGITVRMVTGDNLLTAIAISKDAGIIPTDATESDLKKMAITGPEFAKMSDEDAIMLIPTLRCMARSAPKDKYRLVCLLKSQNMVVAATGDGSNDAPQLKAANVGLAMGIAGTEVAKEASDIIIMNDNFCTIVRAIEWGRTVTANIRKFLQFQLTVNVVALVIAFLGSAVLNESPLTSIQLLYVNLIMDSLGSLALATEGPSKDVLHAEPVHKSASLLTPGLIRNILIISCYQILILLLMLFEATGDALCGIPAELMPDPATLKANEILEYAEIRVKYRYTCIYNFFIFSQLVNMFSCRRINNELNVFEGIFTNMMFSAILIITVIVQIIIMLVPGISDIFKIYDCSATALIPCVPAVSIARITPLTWGICILLALGCFVLHFIGRLSIKLPKEFKVSDKRIAKDIARLAKKAEEKKKKEEKEAEKEALKKNKLQ
uniref:Calcium-transporting ATPase n=1 Tax=Trepomonas sp. PC1 TaxID=1076344 RepID=A0A146KFE3_9EUKA|eukprot:JAP94019.1 Plasma membrane calcium-transporting ATPase [Trepomonas sp. PC1]